jgi:diaminopimelate epimerase
MIPFTKMHGCGNDYVYLDGVRDRLPARAAWPALARAMSDRHTGIGADGLIVLVPSRTGDVGMIMYNADGSGSEMCGNGIRCLAKLAHDHGHIRGPEIRVATGAGVLPVRLRGGRRVTGAEVGMGPPRLVPAAVPVDLAGTGPRLDLRLAVPGHGRIDLVCVGMGNPHAVCFVPDPDRSPVTTLGPLVEHHPRFPRRTNVAFVARLPDEGGWPVLRQRTWERGSGETLACGTGACAATVAAILTGRIPQRRAIVRLSGGDLRITWSDDRADVRMAGPAATVFTGVWPRPRGGRGSGG